MNTYCIVGGQKHPPHAGCTNVNAIPAIKQSSLDGVRVCGKRGTGLALKDAHRPINGNKCEKGYKACNQDWLNDDKMREYVVCVPEAANVADACPITAISFDSQPTSSSAQFTKATASTSSISHDFYFSKNEKGLPVDSIVLSAGGAPCKNDLEYNFGEN